LTKFLYICQFILSTSLWVRCYRQQLEASMEIEVRQNVTETEVPSQSYKNALIPNLSILINQVRERMCPMLKFLWTAMAVIYGLLPHTQKWPNAPKWQYMHKLPLNGPGISASGGGVVNTQLGRLPSQSEVQNANGNNNNQPIWRHNRIEHQRGELKIEEITMIDILMMI
jgi:hypothetical protein